MGRTGKVSMRSRAEERRCLIQFFYWFWKGNARERGLGLEPRPEVPKIWLALVDPFTRGYGRFLGITAFTLSKGWGRGGYRAWPVAVVERWDTQQGRGAGLQGGSASCVVAIEGVVDTACTGTPADPRSLSWPWRVVAAKERACILLAFKCSLQVPKRTRGRCAVVGNSYASSFKSCCRRGRCYRGSRNRIDGGRSR
jgi:hypothetical protein